MKISAVILAAGLSRRMATPENPERNKLLLPYQGRPLLEQVLQLVASFDFFQHILVTTPAITAQADIPKVFQIVFNPCPQRGQSGSLRLGTMAAAGDGYLYFASDQPRLDKGTVENVLAAAKKESIVYPAFEGKSGTPVFFDACYRKDLLKIRGDTGGRALYSTYRERCIAAPATSAQALLDIDTADEYRRLNEQQANYQRGASFRCVHQH